MMTPVKAHTQRALKQGDGNSNSKASKQPAQNHNVISSLGTTSTASSRDHSILHLPAAGVRVVQSSQRCGLAKGVFCAPAHPGPM